MTTTKQKTMKALAERLAGHELDLSTSAAPETAQLSHDARALGVLLLEEMELQEQEAQEQVNPADLACCLELLQAAASRASAAANDDPAQDALVVALGTARAIVAERKRAEAVLGTMAVLEDALHQHISEATCRALEAEVKVRQLEDELNVAVATRRLLSDEPGPEVA